MWPLTFILAALAADAGESHIGEIEWFGRHGSAEHLARDHGGQHDRARWSSQGDTIAPGIVQVANLHTLPVTTRHTATVEPKQYRLASYLTLGIALGAGGILYYKTPGLQDFDHGFAEAWRHRFTRMDRHRFDDNAFGMNHLMHPVAGRAYYGIARAGRLSAPESVFLTALGSSIWEYLIEIREVVSINDQIVTIVAGSVLGETLYQHQSYFLQRPNFGSGNAAATWIFGFPFALPDLIARSRGTAATAPGTDGRTMTRELAVSYTSMYAGPDEGAGGIQLEMTSHVRKIPPVSSYGRSTEVITGIPLSQLSVGTSPGERRLEVFSAVSPLLWSVSDMREHGDGSQQGYHLLVGPSWSYRLSTRSAGVEDHAANTGLLGIVKEFELSAPPLTTTWKSHASLDFTSIHSHALPTYMEAGSLEGTKSILQHGYYYGYGGSLESRAEVGIGRVGLVAEGFALGARSIQGLDRWQEDVVDDFALSDTRVRWQAGGIWKISPQIDLALTRRGQAWQGRASGVEVRSRESDTATGLRIRF